MSKRKTTTTTTTTTSSDVTAQAAPPSPVEQKPAPSKTPPTLEQVMAYFETRPTEDLRNLSGKLLGILKRRAGEARAETPTDPPEKAAAKAQAKEDYVAKRDTYKARPFGVQCVATGKVLKRSFETAEEAVAAADLVTSQTKLAYVPVQLA